MEGNRFVSVSSSVAPFLVSFGALILLVSPTFESVFSRWLKLDESYSHGILLLAVVAVIVVRKWWLEPPVAGFYPWWFLPFLLSLFGYAVGGLLRVEALQQLVLVPLILSTLAILVGWQQGRKFILPVGILVFAMPFWDYLSWPLQLMTVAVNEFGLGLLDIDFRIDGVFVYLTGVGAFEVANGCSGLRYLMVGQSLALIYGELNLRALRSRMILFLAAAGLALIANWIRVFVIIYMGYETNMQSSLIEDHDNFGWWVFAATLIPLFLLGRRLEKTPAEQKPEYGERAAEVKKSRPGFTYIASLFILALSVGALLALPSSKSSIKSMPDTYDLRLDGEHYGPVFSSGLEGWRPQVTNPDRVYRQTLFRRMDAQAGADGMPAVFYTAIHTYDFQRQGAELIQYANRTYDPDEWRLGDMFFLKGPDERVLRGVTLQSRVSGKTIHLAYGYYVEGFWKSDQLRAKLAQLAGLFNARTDASQITFGVSCDGCNGREALRPVINRALPKLIGVIDDRYRD